MRPKLTKRIATAAAFVILLAVPAGAASLWVPWNFADLQTSPMGKEVPGWLSSDTATLALGGRAVARDARPQSGRNPAEVGQDQQYLNITHGWEYTFFSFEQRIRPFISMP